MVLILDGNEDNQLNGNYQVFSASGNEEVEEIFLCQRHDPSKQIRIGFVPGQIPDEAFERGNFMVVGNTLYCE